jgi:hypothetical protein
MIEVGMVIKNSEGQELHVSNVVKGIYGLLVIGYMPERHMVGEAYLVPELAAEDPVWGWYGWARKTFAVLPTGLKIGAVTRWVYDPRTIEEYDSKLKETWDTIRTEEAMRKEEGNGNSPS